MSLVLRLNLVFAAAILVVLALRVPVRRLCGARIAYGLWLIPLVSAISALVPARVVHVTIPALAPLPAQAAPVDHSALWLALWGVGVLCCLGVLAFRQHRFVRTLGALLPRSDLGERVFTTANSQHGPAVIGVMRPRIVTPADFEQRFTAAERAAVLAHERTHLAHGDPLINAAVMAVQCLAWFNPFAHLGARALRLDQELACDAAVLEHTARRTYAEAILKTQLAVAAPLACAWPSPSNATLKERITMLKQSLPSRPQRLLGASALALVVAGVSAAAWAAQPARVVATFAPVAAEVATTTIAADDELAGGAVEHRRIVSEGDHDRELTPEERAELEAALAEMREAIANIHIDMDAVREAARTSVAHIDHAEIAHAVAEAQAAANAQSADEAQRAAMESMRAVEADLANMRIDVDMPDVRVEVPDAEMREAMRVALAEAMRDMPAMQAEIRAALRDAERDLARERAEASARGDTAEAEALLEAERRLREARERQESEESR